MDYGIIIELKMLPVLKDSIETTLVYDFYNKRRKELNSGIQPNRAHILLHELEKNIKFI